MNAHATETTATAVSDFTDGRIAEPMPNAGSMVQAQPAPALVGADALLMIIEKIVLTPGANLDALDRIVALRERVAASEAKAAFDRALSAMQPTLPSIDSKGKITVYKKPDRDKPGGPVEGVDVPQQKTPYALLADINDAVRPGLGEHGFAISHRIGQAADGKITITGILSHRDGHREETTIILKHDATGSKNEVQAVGSTISYGRRYTTLALLNISSRAPQDMDDDGKAAGVNAGKPEVTEEEFAALRELLVKTNTTEEKFLETYEVASVEALSGIQYGQAFTLLNQKVKKLARAAAEQGKQS